MAKLNLSQIFQDAQIAGLVYNEISLDNDKLQAGQAVTESVPLSVYGHHGTFTISFTPDPKA